MPYAVRRQVDSSPLVSPASPSGTTAQSGIQCVTLGGTRDDCIRLPMDPVLVRAETNRDYTHSRTHKPTTGGQ